MTLATVSGEVNGQKYTLTPPVVYLKQLRGLAGGGGIGEGRPLDIQNDSYVMCFTGPRGADKTESLTFWAIYAMSIGMECYANYPIEFTLVHPSGEHEYKKVTVVTVADIIEHLGDMYGAFIAADEWQDIVGKFDYATKKAKFVQGHIARIRKYHCSMGWTSKFEDWLAGRDRDELDIEICCEDVAKSSWGYGKCGKGDYCIWRMKDHSGLWSGHKFNPKMPVTHDFTAYLKPIQGSYDTDFSVSVMESVRGFEFDLEKKVITDKKAKPEMNRDLLRNTLVSMFDKKDRWYGRELWVKLGIDEKDKVNRKAVYEIMDTLGIEQTARGYRRDYDAVPV